VSKLLARIFLWSNGWETVGTKAADEKLVLIAAPHTSNWDFPYLLIFAAHFDLKIRWMGKHSLFRPPMGWIMRALGGIPIVRERRENIVPAMARSFEDYDELVLVVPAEGTRRRVEYWKSGFYHIARMADVPIVMSYLDYSKKTGGFGEPFHLSGDLTKDMDAIRDFYEGRKGKYPEKFGPIRLREESEEHEGDD